MAIDDLLPMEGRCIHLYRHPEINCADCLLERVADRDAEIARLKRALVWLLKSDAEIITPDLDNNGRFRWLDKTRIRCWKRWNGTDESLIEIVCRLAEEG